MLQFGTLCACIWTTGDLKMNIITNRIFTLFTLIGISLLPNIGYAENSELSGANTAWILTSTALVCLRGRSSWAPRHGRERP